MALRDQDGYEHSNVSTQQPRAKDGAPVVTHGRWLTEEERAHRAAQLRGPIPQEAIASVMAHTRSGMKLVCEVPKLLGAAMRLERRGDRLFVVCENGEFAVPPE